MADGPRISAFESFETWAVLPFIREREFAHFKWEFTIRVCINFKSVRGWRYWNTLDKVDHSEYVISLLKCFNPCSLTFTSWRVSCLKSEHELDLCFICSTDFNWGFISVVYLVGHHCYNICHLGCIARIFSFDGDRLRVSPCAGKI